MILGKTWRVDGGPYLVHDLPKRALERCGCCGWRESRDWHPTLPPTSHPPRPPRAATTRPGQAGPHQEAGTGKGGCALHWAGSLQRQEEGEGEGTSGAQGTPQGPGSSRHCSQVTHTASGFWDSQPLYPAPQKHRVTAGQRMGARAWLEQWGPGLFQGREPTQTQEKLAPSATQPLPDMPSIFRGEKSIRVHSTGRGWESTWFPEAERGGGADSRATRQTHPCQPATECC